MKQIMSRNTHTLDWEIVSIENETHDTKTLTLRATSPFNSFIAGQYVTVLLPAVAPHEGKSYSISSIPDTSLITLTVKEMGVFSRALTAHTVGDHIETTEPYGFFYPEFEDEKPLTFIAGGVGITPCMSIIRTALTQGYASPITLFYSNKTTADCIFKEAIAGLASTYPSFTVHQHLTREVPTDTSVTHGRITEHDIRTHSEDSQNTEFFICGSINFTKDMWRTLREIGIPSTQIYTEGFF